MIRNRKAVIFGIRSHKIKKSEISLFRKANPWGIILFSRNIKNISQAKALTNDIKKNLKDKNYPILIDQEGGRVSRLNKIIDLSLFPQSYFGQLYRYNKKNFQHHYKIHINMVSDILKKIGVNINIVPVLDVRRKKSHKIIGSRSFSENPNEVLSLSKLCSKSM